MHTIRVAIGRLDPLARRLGHYTAYQLDEREYVGTYEGDIRSVLREIGYVRYNLAALKYHWNESDNADDGSFRKVDPENPRWQWHVHIWRVDGHSWAVASHYEYRSDIIPVSDETPSEAIERVRLHYRPTWGENYLLGETCDELPGLLQDG